MYYFIDGKQVMAREFWTQYKDRTMALQMIQDKMAALKFDEEKLRKAHEFVMKESLDIKAKCATLC